MHGMIGRSGGRVSRVVRRRNDWTLKEHEIVVSYWPDVEAIKKRLQHRSVPAIRAFAGKCNLTTGRHIWTAAEEAKLRKLAASAWSRKEIAAELGLSPEQVAGRLAYAKISIARKPPAPSAHPLVNAIRQRAHALNMTLIELDRSLGAQKIFQQSAGRQKVAHIHVERAVKALGGQLTVEWCDE